MQPFICKIFMYQKPRTCSPFQWGKLFVAASHRVFPHILGRGQQSRNRQPGGAYIASLSCLGIAIGSVFAVFQNLNRRVIVVCAYWNLLPREKAGAC